MALRLGPVERRYAANCIWTDSHESNAASNLRTTLWKIRRDAGDVVASFDEHLALHEDVKVDFREAVELARMVLNDPQPGVRFDIESSLLTGELLPSWSDDWVAVERESFRQLQLHALEMLSQRFSSEQQHYRAIEAGLLAVAHEPLRESAHRVLIEAHLAAGNFSEAVRQFRTVEDILRVEFGLTPSPQLAELVRSR